ncbi:ankyrin repeat domain-containing protein [Flavobacterium sp. DG1-102-2]|uniref:ankyrin repeat domain-containing protein n=1 Tax=Flavobacterium sp. DG1-102-2 TaxID=3081663 RepID=UPI00294A91DF|nr:ankyrin repeat domain-containing protein [Flavobacterium sp. DG1-102-2]MDV6166981.1 ankyrin repeat domain-containing protein [Flavobacterium sp. DG1-102-2]
MKKSIIYLGLALVAFSNVTVANTLSTAPNAEMVSTHKTVTPLGMAIAKGDVAAVKKFIEYGADIHEKSNGMTPLMIAARYNQVEIVKLLLSKGADVKAKDEKGISALKYAEASNAAEAVVVIKQALNA